MKSRLLKIISRMALATVLALTVTQISAFAESPQKQQGIEDGFSFAQEHWDSLVRWFPWSAVNDLPTDPTAPGDFGPPSGELWDLRAIRLRTSLFWRDHSIDVEGRVDQRLLESLNALSGLLIRGIGVSRSLSPSVANGLIGRFFYIYFLFDRGFIDHEWVTARVHREVDRRSICRLAR